MNKKKKGSRNEHRSMDLLAAEGYRCTRAAGSLGAWDVIGIGLKDVVLCQVKSNEWPRRDEMQKLMSFKAPQNCHKIVHLWRDRQNEPEVMELE
jgi:Holliday junction resolvase